MRFTLYIGTLVLTAACSSNEFAKVDEPGAAVGEVLTGDEIVDGSAGVSGPEEVCDGIDNDGDGAIDEGTMLTFFIDADGDGYGSEAIEACEPPLGTVEISGDCADDDPAVNPDADEVCNRIDDDCNGYVDEGLIRDYFIDLDADGYGAPSSKIAACVAPEGYVANDGDCDDGSALISPDQAETCNGTDDDCDGRVDEGVSTTFYTDADDDGYGDPATAFPSCGAPTGAATIPGDCDDSDPAINPEAVEVCDGVDQDCDGAIDDGATVGTILFYIDSDGDGFGRGAPFEECIVPAGFSAENGDCDDFDPLVFPDADERCNGQDDDCDGDIDEGVLTEYYTDGDGDGIGREPFLACELPSGASTVGGDCDDARDDTYPDADERCDGRDNDCDGTIDEGVLIEFFVDEDGDGFGTTGLLACELEDGTAALSGDCDDDNEAVNPGASERCDGIDNDCDGTVDIDAVDATDWYEDVDGDSFGDEESVLTQCDAPDGYSAEPGDCDPDLADVYPGAPEYCDGLDNDCNGTIDDDTLDTPTWFADFDGDGFGQAADAIESCDAPDDYVDDATDCDDDDPDTYPGADEYCDAIDNDCDGEIDEEAVDGFTLFEDADGDGYGSVVPFDTCDFDDGLAEEGGDCDDDDDEIFPGADENCDGVDEDCDGVIDDEAGCPCTQYHFGSNSYLFCTSNRRWTNARNWCRDRGYELATMTNSDEEYWVVQTVIRGYWDVPNEAYWIGLNDRSSERGGSRSGWVWVSGESYSHQAWSDYYGGQPDNYRGEDCVEVNRWPGSPWEKNWNDLDCADNIHYICEAGP